MRPRAVQEPPKSAQGPFKSAQEPLKSAQDSPRAAQELPERDQEPPKSAKEPPKSAQEAPKSAQEPPKSRPRTPKSFPRAPESQPRCAQEPAKSRLRSATRYSQNAQPPPIYQPNLKGPAVIAVGVGNPPAPCLSSKGAAGVLKIECSISGQYLAFREPSAYPPGRRAAVPATRHNLSAGVAFGALGAVLALSWLEDASKMPPRRRQDGPRRL